MAARVDSKRKRKSLDSKVQVRKKLFVHLGWFFVVTADNASIIRKNEIGDFGF
jgi:hypothetical protein